MSALGSNELKNTFLQQTYAQRLIGAIKNKLATSELEGVAELFMTERATGSETRSEDLDFEEKHRIRPTGGQPEPIELLMR